MREPVLQSRNVSRWRRRGRSAYNASQLLQLDVDEDEVTFQAAATHPARLGGMKLSVGSESLRRDITTVEKQFTRPECTANQIIDEISGQFNIRLRLLSVSFRLSRAMHSIGLEVLYNSVHSPKASLISSNNCTFEPQPGRVDAPAEYGALSQKAISPLDTVDWTEYSPHRQPRLLKSRVRLNLRGQNAYAYPPYSLSLLRLI